MPVIVDHADRKPSWDAEYERIITQYEKILIEIDFTSYSNIVIGSK